MMRMLKENWLWIVAPIVLVLGVLFAFLLLTENESARGFIYNL